MIKTLIATIFMVGITLGNVWAANEKFSISADTIDFDMKAGMGVAKGNVILFRGNGQAKGEYAQFDNKRKSGFLQGHVVADQDGYHIDADTLTVHDENHFTAAGKAVLKKDGRVLEAAIIDYYKNTQILKTGNGRSKLTDVDGSILCADIISYDHGIGLASASGGVKIISEVRNLTASADQAIYNVNKAGGNYLELIGNAVAVQDGNMVKGNHLKLNNARVAQADGGVQIKYYPKKQTTMTESGRSGSKKVVNKNVVEVETSA